MNYINPPVIGYLNFTASEIEEARCNERLLLIDIHMGNLCNLHCPGCYRDAGKSLAEELTIDEYRDVLQQAHTLGAKTWIITGSGEPFLDPKLFSLIEFANSLDMGVVIFTNNTQITPELAGWLLDHQVSVVAKLNSFVPATQDFIVGTSGASKNIYRGLNNLMATGLNQLTPSRLGIDSVIVQRNYQEIPEIFRFCRDNNIIPYITTELSGGRGVENAGTLDVSVREIREMFFNLRDIDRQKYGFDWQPHPPIVAGGTCQKSLYQLFVGPTGEIGVCPGLSMGLGNIRTISLVEALKSELVHKIRHPEEYCAPCPVCRGKNDKCTGGCLLSKYNAGDIFGTDPQCRW